MRRAVEHVTLRDLPGGRHGLTVEIGRVTLALVVRAAAPGAAGLVIEAAAFADTEAAAAEKLTRWKALR